MQALLRIAGANQLFRENITYAERANDHDGFCKLWERFTKAGLNVTTENVRNRNKTVPFKTRYRRR